MSLQDSKTGERHAARERERESREHRELTGRQSMAHMPLNQAGTIAIPTARACLTFSLNIATEPFRTCGADCRGGAATDALGAAPSPYAPVASCLLPQQPMRSGRDAAPPTPPPTPPHPLPTQRKKTNSNHTTTAPAADPEEENKHHHHSL